MRAVSLWQPWAQLVVLGVKLIETRPWKTNYRGTLLIHATKETPPDRWARIMADPDVEDLLAQHGHAGGRGLPHGAIVGAVELVRCSPTEEFTHVPLTQQRLGDFSQGRFGWILAGARLIDPVPCRGSNVGLFRPPPDVLATVRERLEGVAGHRGDQ